MNNVFIVKIQYVSICSNPWVLRFLLTYQAWFLGLFLAIWFCYVVMINGILPFITSSNCQLFVLVMGCFFNFYTFVSYCITSVNSLVHNSFEVNSLRFFMHISLFTYILGWPKSSFGFPPCKMALVLRSCL